MSLAWSLYRAMAPAIGALAPAAGWVVSSAERRYWEERLGRVERPGGCDAWVHAASLGEALGVRPLVAGLRSLQPEARLWLTASTRGGRARLAATGERVSLAPMDAPQHVRRFFTGIEPERLFLIETELWPHWLLRARAEGVPVAAVSARLSARSLRHYGGFGPEFRSLIRGLDAVLCQSGTDAERWLALGAPPGRTEVIGNLKNDALPRAATARGEALHRLALDPARPVLVLGSVRPGEVRLLARAWRGLPGTLREGWQVVAVPRHPRASADLEREAHEAGIPTGRGASRPGEWRWDDGLGVLAEYYAVADAAFVGGSLLPYGGHNPLEPAACGAAVLMGPYGESQRGAVHALARAEALQVVRDPESLDATLRALLSDPARVKAAGEAGRAVCEGLRGATSRALDCLARWRLWPAR